MLRVDLVEDVRGLEALIPAWWELWRASPAATPFQAPAWLVPWWHVFAPGRLATLAIWAGDRLTALAPFYVETGPLGRRLLPVGIGVSDSLDILVDASAADEPLSRLALELGHLPHIDTWEFEELPPSASCWGLPLPDGLTEIVADQSACPVLSLSGDDGLACVPSRQRRKLRMAQHRVARRGGEVEAADLDRPDEFLDHLFQLHGARWRARGEGGVLDSDAVQLFHRKALPRLAEADLVDALTLTVEDRVVGAYYGLRRPGDAFAYLGGFDPAFAFESPGAVLLGHAVANAAARGERDLHLLRGREPYKYAWGAVDRWNRRRSWRRRGQG